MQEALTNSFKHSDARQVDVVLNRSRDTNEIVVSVSDNGKGMASNEKRTGMGLSGMRERVEMLGGTFSIDYRPRRGVHGRGENLRRKPAVTRVKAC